MGVGYYCQPSISTIHSKNPCRSFYQLQSLTLTYKSLSTTEDSSFWEFMSALCWYFEFFLILTSLKLFFNTISSYFKIWRDLPFPFWKKKKKNEQQGDVLQNCFGGVWCAHFKLHWRSDSLLGRILSLENRRREVPWRGSPRGVHARPQPNVVPVC